MEGWKFTGLTYPGVYHFVRCQPEDVVYQLDYNEEGLRILTDQLDSKNFYAFNPSFDKR